MGVLTFDRTSDSPVGVFPERRAYERTQAIADVWDNFGFDPATGQAMIAAAGKTARKYKIDRAEVDDISSAGTSSTSRRGSPASSTACSSPWTS